MGMNRESGTGTSTPARSRDSHPRRLLHATRVRWRRFRRAWKPWRWRSLLLLIPGLVLFALFALQQEPILATGPALLIDNVLRAASFIAIAATGVVLIASENIAQRAGIVASLAILILSGAALTSGFWSPNRSYGVLALAAVALLLAACNLWLGRTAWGGFKAPLGKATAALLGVAAVPLFSFWAETSYLPSHNTVTLVGSIETEVQQAPDMSTHLVVSSVLENSADVRAFVIISSLTVCQWSDESDRDAHQGTSSDLPNCMTLARPFRQSSWLDPKVTLTTLNSVPLAADRPMVEIRLRLAYARADRVVVVPGTTRDATSEELGTCKWAQISGLRPQSRLSALVLRDQALMYGDRTGKGRLNYYLDSEDGITCAGADSEATPAIPGAD